MKETQNENQGRKQVIERTGEMEHMERNRENKVGGRDGLVRARIAEITKTRPGRRSESKVVSAQKTKTWRGGPTVGGKHGAGQV